MYGKSLTLWEGEGRQEKVMEGKGIHGKAWGVREGIWRNGKVRAD